VGLNCKPGQMAWIDMPRTRQNEVLGLTQLHGHVVKAVRLLAPGPRFPNPTWEVEPPQAVRVAGPVPACFKLQPGDSLVAEGIPDSWLRPFEDLPAEDIERLVRELAFDGEAR
jgi:hypothetical protein